MSAHVNFHSCCITGGTRSVPPDVVEPEASLLTWSPIMKTLYFFIFFFLFFFSVIFPTAPYNASNCLSLCG